MAVFHKRAANAVKDSRRKHCDGGGTVAGEATRRSRHLGCALHYHGRRRQMGLGSLSEVTLRQHLLEQAPGPSSATILRQRPAMLAPALTLR